jgi:hypothetical protein
MEVQGYILLQELSRRLRLKNAGGMASRTVVRAAGADVIKSHLFPEQRAVLEDSAKRLVLWCPRRAGKSMGVATMFADVAIAYPKSQSAMYSLNLGASYKNIVSPLKEICARYNINIRVDEQDNEIVWPNGSKTFIFPAEKKSEVGKGRGPAYHFVAIDEAQNIKDEILEEIIDEVASPALEDYEGPLLLAGTPKNARTGYFYEACSDDGSVWSKHHWTRAQNIYFPLYMRRQQQPKYKDMTLEEIAQDHLEEILRRHKWTRETPKFRREHLGEWVKDNATYIYPYDPSKNAATGLPDGQDWQYGMGGDLGTNALVIIAWSRTCPDAYVVDAFKAKHTTIDALSADVVRMSKKWKVTRYMFDAAALGKYIVREVRQRTGLPLLEADKKDKASIQEIVRNDLQCGRIKVLPSAQVLIDEWTKLQYDDDGMEPKRADNHCSDAHLYIYKWARNYFSKPAPIAAQKTEDELIEERMWAKAEKQSKRQSHDMLSRLKRML